MRKNIATALTSFVQKLRSAFPALSTCTTTLFRKIIQWRKARMARFRSLPWYRKLGNIAFTISWMFVVYLLVVDLNILWLFGKSPTLKAIENPEQSLVTTIISADGKEIGKFFS